MPNNARRAGHGTTGVRVALVVLVIGLGQASFEWLRSLGMDAVTGTVVWAIPVGTAAAVTAVLWLASDRAFALRTWLPLSLCVPVYLMGLFGLLTASASLVASIVTGAGVGIAVVTGAARYRDRPRSAEYTASETTNPT